MPTAARCSLQALPSMSSVETGSAKKLRMRVADMSTTQRGRTPIAPSAASDDVVCIDDKPDMQMSTTSCGRLFFDVADTPDEAPHNVEMEQRASPRASRGETEPALVAPALSAPAPVAKRVRVWRSVTRPVSQSAGESADHL